MKKIYYILFACVAMMTLSACSLKEDPIFEESASLRSELHIAKVREVLTSAPNGWLMEYYGNLSFGGYNVLVKFEGDKATVASEKWGANHKAGIDENGKVVTSTSGCHFKLEQSMGTVLSFDEYNETFHYFSMPNNPDYTYDKDKGLEGDFEFRVIKANADSVIMRGKKHNTKIIMTRIPADKTWESIINEAKETEEYMSSRSYTLAGEDVPEGKEITATSNGGYRCFVFTYKNAMGDKETVTAPYIVKEDGFYFYREVEVDGIKLNGLKKGDTDEYFVFRNNPNLQLDTYMPTLAECLTTSTWYQRYGSVGEYAKPFWDAMLAKLKTGGKGGDEIKLYTATIGPNGDNKWACALTAGGDAPIYGFSLTSNTDGTQVTFKQVSTNRNKAGKDYYNKYAWKGVLDCLFNHTFNLSCDYQRRPKWITLTDVNEPTNVITVYAQPSYFMEDQSYYQDKN